MSFRAARPTTPRVSQRDPIRRPFSSRSNDENIQAADTSSKGSARKPRHLTRARSAPVLQEKTQPESPAPVPQDQGVPQDVLENATQSVIASLTNGTIELRPAVDIALGDNQSLMSLVTLKLVDLGCKKGDRFSKNNEKIMMDHIKDLKSQCKQNEQRRKALLEVTAMIEELIGQHIAKGKQELLDQRSLQEAAAEDWHRQRKQTESNHLQAMDTQEMIRQQICSQAQMQEDRMGAQIHGLELELKGLNARFEAKQLEHSSVREQLAATTAEKDSQGKELMKVSQEKNDLEMKFDTYKEHHTTKADDQMNAITELKIMVGGLTAEVHEKKQEVAVKDTGINQSLNEIALLKQRLQDEELKRRAMHNAMQELKGNIRVFCRTRPLNAGSDNALRVSSVANTVSLGYSGDDYDFSFDKVFGPEAKQPEIFDEVSCLVQSALDGYKVCIFAYGQTGSGKTHTMQGGRDASSWGLIPRALSQIFEAAQDMRTKGWTWSLEASFLEVYNETIRDLLRKDDGSQPPVHTIVHDDEWGLIVTNVEAIEVDSMEQIQKLMDLAGKKRSVGNTDMNAESSRSHAVFCLYLKGVNLEIGTELCGALHLVDLAGSERLDKSGATGSRLKETQNINKSLSSLADVFIAKAEGRSHVPFRNSKLTYLMEPCLSGQGKTLMMVNVGPEDSHAHETLCSLRFAKQVSQCNTGKPKRAAKMAGSASAPPSRPATPTSRSQTPRQR